MNLFEIMSYGLLNLMFNSVAVGNVNQITFKMI